VSSDRIIGHWSVSAIPSGRTGGSGFKILERKRPGA
jgi:hypothetical protein